MNAWWIWPGVAGRAARAADVFITVIDGHGRVRWVNPTMRRELGFTRQQLHRLPFHHLWVAPEHRALAWDAVTRAIAEGRAYPQEADWVDASGGRRRVAMRNSVMRDRRSKPWAVVTVGADVTERRSTEYQLRIRAETDPLTGLRNRAALFDALATQLAPGSGGCGVLFVDLDDFKTINDTLGHEAGDQVLNAVAHRLIAVTNTTDVTARLGGDEFVIACPKADQTRLDELARRLREAMTAPVETSGGAVSVTVSIGTAVGVEGRSSEELLATADTHMYGAKWRRKTPRT